MDLSFLEHLIPNLAAWLHIQPATLLLYLGLICTGANLLGRYIPDNATGFWGYVRIVAKVIGMYAQNRVAPGIGHSDVIKDIVGQTVKEEVKEEIRDLASDADALIPEAARDVVRDPFGAAAQKAGEYLDDELDRK